MIFIMPGLDSREAMKSYNAARYHKPADDMSQTLFFESGVTWTNIQLGITERLLNVKKWPVLNPDGFLGRRYGRVSAR
jgi:hypothetical protein